MKFLIVTHTKHKFNEGKWFAYEPYMREMNLWIDHVDEVRVVAPISKTALRSIEKGYVHKNLTLVPIPSFDLLSLGGIIALVYKIPYIFFVLVKEMYRTQHIHLRCPGNIGLLGCFAQLLFPNKTKTVKYAGNWDPLSNQPSSYRLQKKILNSTSISKNMRVLVYGSWKKSSKNIVPFFTASYYERDKEFIADKRLNNTIRFIFVGGLTEGKRPLLSVKVIEALKQNGYSVRLDIYGDGVLKTKIAQYIAKRRLEADIQLHGNVSQEIVKTAFKESHFLIFVSKSEGWPKVVAESMFWKCLPISAAVSCIPTMLDHGKRGSIVSPDIHAICSAIGEYIKDEKHYINAINNACDWSRKYTMNLFEEEIEKLLHE